MKEEDAVKYLRVMLFTVQKLRSIMDEDGIITDRIKDVPEMHLTVEEAGKTWKWVWGNANILPTLSKVIDACDDPMPVPLDPLTFYNLMFIAIQLEPMIGTACRMQDSSFPDEMNLNWLRGWD